MRRIVGLVFAVCACGSDNPANTSIEPERLTDTNPDPNIVEVELVATTGTHE